ncbi:MAG: hypothetical protein ACE366_19810 [Bradymonadia bacterium]
MSDQKPIDEGAEAWITALANLEREQRGEIAADARLEALSAGDLSDEDLAELQALAASEPEWGEALEAFEPLDDAALDRMTAQVLAEMGVASAEEAAPSDVQSVKSDTLLAHEEPAETSTPDNVVQLSAHRRPRWVWGAGIGSLAAAAALAFFMMKPNVVPMPGYGIEVAMGQSDFRGDEPQAKVTRLTPNTRLDVTLRPESKVDAPVAVRAFLKSGDSVVRWNPPVKVLENGVVQLTGRTGDLMPSALKGRVTMLLAVGVEEALPHTPEQAAEAMKTGASEGWRLLRHELELLP